jgi:hypothetical protein
MFIYYPEAGLILGGEPAAVEVPLRQKPLAVRSNFPLWQPAPPQVPFVTNEENPSRELPGL